MTSTLILNANTVTKLLNVVDQGLVAGLGEAIPGKMCVEAAVCYALGLDHGDAPRCVGSTVRMFKIALNDKNWSSNSARAEGMRRLAVAQLGSDQIDQKEFTDKLVLKTINTLLPTLFRLPIYNGMFESYAITCEKVKDLQQGRLAARAVAKIIYATASAVEAANAAANAAAYAAAYAATATADAAEAATATAASAAATAAAAAYANAAAPTENYFLTLIANLALEVLQEMKSSGVEWLYLCETPNHD